MNLVIYNINSFGGIYEYSKYLFKAYKANPYFEQCHLLVPANAAFNEPGVIKTLSSDKAIFANKLLKRFHFLYRSFVNPFRLYRFLKGRQPTVVVLNDFDQVTAPFWAPLFRWLRKKHCFTIVLHDPNRDDYFPVKSLSESTMNSAMSVVDIAFYHGYMPEKKYYKGDFLRVKIPHGIYDNPEVDENFLTQLQELSAGSKVIGALGNIRQEKNYEALIDALTQLDNTKLLIAGNIANSSVSVDYYKDYAQKRGVGEKVIWVVRYLDQASFNAAIKTCDVILLYYKATFTSQSGIFNTIAPFEKKLLISDAESSLKECVKEYRLGEIVPNDNGQALVASIKTLLAAGDKPLDRNWEKYMADFSWEKHVSIAVEQYKKLMHEY
jgi:glycosyltransferase involved in cell wall biosynthesis